MPAPAPCKPRRGAGVLALVASLSAPTRAAAEPAARSDTPGHGSEESAGPTSTGLISVELDPSAPGRPEPLGPIETEPPEWRPHLEVGADVAFVARTVTTGLDGKETGVSYDPALGFGLHASWAIVKYLRFTAYFIDASHSVRYADNALGLDGSIQAGDVSTFSFGARISPTLHFTDAIRSWITAGAGWGRFEFGRLQVDEGSSPAGARTYEVRERSTPFVEFPLGVGSSIDVWPRWLSVVVELTAAPVVDQGGSAMEVGQTIDPDGRKRAVGGYPQMAGHFVQTLGLSLLL
jgi:hypothetical protein